MFGPTAELVLAWRWFPSIGVEDDERMRIDSWILIVAGVLLPLWIVLRIVMLPALLNAPGHGRLLATYMQYRAEQRGKPRRR